MSTTTLERTITVDRVDDLADILEALTDRGMGYRVTRDGRGWLITVLA